MSSEDSYVMPESWRAMRSQRRTSAGVVPYRPDPGARALIDTMFARRGAAMAEVFAHPGTEPGPAGAAQLWLSGAESASPLGAAAVVVAARVTGSRHDFDLTLFADLWLAERGAVFAAEAAAELMTLTTATPFSMAGGSWSEGMAGLRLIRPGFAQVALNRVGVELRIVLRVRHALAAAGDEVYAAAVTALAALRDGTAQRRAATSVLVPTEAAWVDEDCREAIADRDDNRIRALLHAVGNPEPAAALLAEIAHSTVPTDATAVTFVDGVGPAAADAVTRWLDNAKDNWTFADHRKFLLSILSTLPGDAAMAALIERTDEKYVQPALLESINIFPARAVRLLAVARDRPGVASLLRSHVLGHPEVAAHVADDLPPDAAAAVRGVLADADGVVRAPLSDVPALLLDPPWQNRKRAAKPMVIRDVTCTDPPALAWQPSEQDTFRFTALHRSSYADRGGWPAAADRIRTGYDSRHSAGGFFVDAPDDIARPLLATYDPEQVGDAITWFRPVIARFELAALPATMAMARRSPPDLAEALQPFTGPEVTVLMADWLARLKSAQAWFRRHPASAARALVPHAVGPAGTGRRQAERALLALAADGHVETVRAAAKDYGPEVAAVVETLLAADPLLVLPARIPPIPAWADPVSLPPVDLRAGTGALPAQAIPHLITVLMLSKSDEPYAGLDVVRQACEPAGLARFGWALFERWQFAGSPPKEGWVFDALSLLGDDETVRRLTALVLAWPDEGAHARAVTGATALAGIGSDVALSHLHGIGQRSKSKALRAAANDQMAYVAAGLGLSADQLADRLVPRFGLTADGSMTLDYGPRQFVVGFDEQLRPYVTDRDGNRLKALPKPGERDDDGRASSAYRRFAALKKDVRTTAADLVRRLERAMVTGRQWHPDEFRELFLDHPLVRHIARRLVWSMHDSTGAQVGEVRVAEDHTLAGQDDEMVVLTSDRTVGVAHPAGMADWAEVFADYQILQPFAQVSRQVHRLGADEGTAFNLTRFEGRKVPAVRLIGLGRRGWSREAPQDGGMQRQLTFTVTPGLEVVIALDPGIYAGDPAMYPEQTLREIVLRKDNRRAAFGSLAAAAASEVLRDLTEVTT